MTKIINNSLKYILLFSTIMLLSSCIKLIEIGDIQSVKITNSSSKDFTLTFKVKVKNPNFYKVTLKQIDVTVTVNNFSLGNVKNETNIVIPANCNEYIDIPIDVTIDNLFGAGLTLLSSIGSKKINIEVKGNVQVKALFKTFKVEINEKKEVAT